MRLARWLAVPALLASQAHAAPIQGACEVNFRVGVDHVVPVPNALVDVTQYGKTSSLSTNANGATPFASLNCLEEMVVTVHGAAIPRGGTTVGQTFLYDNRVHSSTDLDSLSISVSVPECLPILQKSQGGKETFHDGTSTAWWGEMEAGEQFASKPYVGFLPESTSVEAYLQYMDAYYLPAGEHGLIFRVEEDVVLPKNGVGLTVNVRKYYDSPQVLAYQFGYEADENSLTASLLDAPSLATSGDLFVLMKGKLVAGDNLILLHDGSDHHGRMTDDLKDRVQVARASAAPSSGTETAAASLVPSMWSQATGNAGSCEVPDPPSCTTDCVPPTPDSCGGFTPVLLRTTNTTRVTAVSKKGCNPYPDGAPVTVNSGAGFVGGINIWVIGNIGGTAYNEYASVAGPCQCTQNFFCQPSRTSEWKVKRWFNTGFEFFSGQIVPGEEECLECIVKTRCSVTSYMVPNTCKIPGCEG